MIHITTNEYAVFTEYGSEISDPCTRLEEQNSVCDSKTFNLLTHNYNFFS